jgi:regulatory protein YycI of two-component signal transduction system YycFG
VDWAKAKTILIILFLLLNVFLLAYLVIEGAGAKVTEKVINDTETILNNNNIILQCDIPLYTREISSLEYSRDSIDRQKILHFVFGDETVFDMPGDEPVEYEKDGKTLIFTDINTAIYKNEYPDDIISISDISILEKQLREYFSSFIDNMDEYVLDRHVSSESSSIHMLFTYRYKSFLVFDNSILAEVTEKGINSFTYSYKNAKGFLQNPAPIMPAHRVLLKNIEYIKGAVNEPTEILGIDIGFKGHSVGDEMMRSSEGPSWRIVLNNSEPLYFSAFDGTNIQ